MGRQAAGAIEVTPSQLERRWRRLVFERAHQWNRLRWARMDWERDAAAAEVRRLTWELIDMDALRKEADRRRFWATRSWILVDPDRWWHPAD